MPPEEQPGRLNGCRICRRYTWNWAKIPSSEISSRTAQSLPEAIKETWVSAASVFSRTMIKYA